MKSIAVYCSSSNKVDEIYKAEAKKIGLLLSKKKTKNNLWWGEYGINGHYFK